MTPSPRSTHSIGAPKPYAGERKKKSLVSLQVLNSACIVARLPMSFMQAGEVETTAPVASLPVFLSASIPPQARLELFQYPLYARGRSLPVPATAAQRGQRVASRWRPQTNRVEMELPLDMRESVYNHERGAEWAEATASMGTIPVPGETRVKQERGSLSDTSSAVPRFDRMRLESNQIQNATRYMVGTVRHGELHLVPLHAILQMRPSMQHVDLMSQAEDAGRRLPTSDDESDTQSDARRAPVVSLNVSMRSSDATSNSLTSRARTQSAHMNQRDADAERWIDLRFQDVSITPDATDRLLAQQREHLVCTTQVQEFF